MNKVTLCYLSVKPNPCCPFFKRWGNESVRMTFEGGKKSSQSQTDPDFEHKEEQRRSQERTVTLKKERRIGFALSAFVLRVCELWLKTEDSLSTLGPFCPIVSRPLPYPPTQKIPAGAQSDAHPLCSALSERADPVQTQTHRDQSNYAQVLTEEAGSKWNQILLRKEGIQNIYGLEFSVFLSHKWSGYIYPVQSSVNVLTHKAVATLIQSVIDMLKCLQPTSVACSAFV